MPLYFAYGSNMDPAGMGARCPGARPVGAARLPRHRFAMMREGYATVVRDAQATVWGVLWTLPLADVRPLDAYENVTSGLYVKAQQPVIKAAGGSTQALIYVGRTEPSAGQGGGQAHGSARPGYMEAILAAATAWDLPESYLRELGRLVASPRRGTSGAGALVTADSNIGAGSMPTPGRVRPRWATPFDR